MGDQLRQPVAVSLLVLDQEVRQLELAHSVEIELDASAGDVSLGDGEFSVQREEVVSVGEAEHGAMGQEAGQALADAILVDDIELGSEGAAAGEVYVEDVRAAVAMDGVVELHAVEAARTAKVTEATRAPTAVTARKAICRATRMEAIMMGVREGKEQRERNPRSLHLRRTF